MTAGHRFSCVPVRSVSDAAAFSRELEESLNAVGRRLNPIPACWA
jgi:hypothetical protein